MLPKIGTDILVHSYKHSDRGMNKNVELWEQHDSKFKLIIKKTSKEDENARSRTTWPLDWVLWLWRLEEFQQAQIIDKH
jgi:hypothetical protein